MQILFDHSEEDGGVDLLGVLPGKVRRFPDVEGFKVPEIGWNDVQTDGTERFIRSGDEFYFVHSYYAELNPHTVGRTSYAGVDFTSCAEAVFSRRSSIRRSPGGLASRS